MTYKKRIDIMAGMQFAYPGTINNKMVVVGYKIVKFKYNKYLQLVSETEVKRVFFK